MKLVAATFTALMLPLISFANYNGPSITYKCGPTKKLNLDAGPTSGVITKIRSLEIPAIQPNGTFEIKMKVDGVTAENAMNDKVKPETSEEIYTLKEAKSGTMIELQGSVENKYSFDAVFLEFGTPKVVTAGPVPEGTHKLTISLGLVDSNLYYSNPSPMTVQKVVLDCEMTLKY